MGCFSWTFAERTIKAANLREEKPFKLLIPKEFGGGFIFDHYRGYGEICDENGNSYDMYELLAFWNADSKQLKEKLKWDGDFTAMKTEDRYTSENRNVGIDIGCYDEQMDRLRYPLKLVPASSKATYESCTGYSYGDPNQGWDMLTWEEYDNNRWLKTVTHPASYPNR